MAACYAPITETDRDVLRNEPVGAALVLYLGSDRAALSALISPGQTVIWFDREAERKRLREAVEQLEEPKPKKRRTA